MASQPEPYKPDDRERDGYFYGLAGRPRLIARTSTNHWTEPQHIRETWVGDVVCKTPKEYSPVRDEELIAKWENDLSAAIIKALKGCSWNYFFPIRIGLKRIYSQPRSEPPTVLLVAVEKDSLQWERGIAIALACRKILQTFEISNVEVEIREGRCESQVMSKEFEAQIDNDRWEELEGTNELALPMMSFSGYPIGYLEDIKGQGTVGLHLTLLKDGAPTKLYALTCRHVVDNKRPDHQSYTLSEGPRQYHVQANHTGFLKFLEGLERYQESLESEIKPELDRIKAWENWYQFDPTMEHRRPNELFLKDLAARQDRAAYNRRVMEHAEKLEEKDTRKIGHLAYHPSLQVSSLRPGYLKDWALVELDPDKFADQPENKVFVGCKRGFTTENGFLKLVLPKSPFEFREYRHVAKRGATTGLTRGIRSGIEAVIRQPSPSGEYIAWELLIVPEEKFKRFSDNGDSGSAVFSLHGEVIGLVTGSTYAEPEDESDLSNPQSSVRYPGDEWADVTFATPIQWVLEDIEDFTGLQARLA
ncbi:hypothetical protein GGR51DRAFT_553863 [Nemania sp. FL0031]|nr:hypothetical protein GGR51DRAFT_553863 [Nemania sp. FL0031]